MSDIVLINPRFDGSYWGLEHALPLFGKKANLPVACLPLLSALTPPEHRVTLLDENTAPLDFDQIARADIVGVTGMSVQRFRMREILTELKQRGAFTVVGGPWVTVKEDYFGEMADVIFVGEAEDTWPEFLREWQQCSHAGRYEQREKTDMTRVPCPRYDQFDASNYMFGSLQISRGCPFQCEFCDIIVTFGRRPRLKSSAQVIAELEAMRKLGMEIVFIVDDNLIGNRHAIVSVLKEVVAWQKRNGYPMAFFTEASLDLADHPDLLQLLTDANIQAVFIGIESPNPESLRETLKFQNLRQGGSIVEKVHRIQQAGMEVWTGMIVGFDHDDEQIFEAQYDFLRDARVVHALMGMLYAIPKTPLYDRLLAENRLDQDDIPEHGTNVIPLGMSREALSEGYVLLMRRLNDPVAFFDRADSLYHNRGFRFNRAQRDYWRRHPLNWLKWQSITLVKCAVLYHRLMRQVTDNALRQEYRRRLSSIWKSRHEPAALFIYLIKCAAHYHYTKLLKDLTVDDRTLINTV
jgi:radical SAM superfamily enzyme YgiQ (UPF0313 family)